MSEDWKAEFDAAISTHDARRTDMEARLRAVTEYLDTHLPTAVDKISAQLQAHGRQQRSSSRKFEASGICVARCLEVLRGDEIEYAFHAVGMEDGRAGYFSETGVPHLSNFASARYGPLPFGEDRESGQGSIDDIVRSFMNDYAWSLKWPGKQPIGFVDTPTPTRRMGFVRESGEDEE